MAYFNEEYIDNFFLSLLEQSSLPKSEDPKFASKSYNQVYKFVQSIISSEEFVKNFTSNINLVDYIKDDDAEFCFGNFASGRTKYLCLASFEDSDIESGVARSAAQFIIKAFNNEKKNNKLNGSLKISDKYGYFSIDYKL